MFKILIVEDDPDTSAELSEYIAEEIDEVHTDTAMTVPEARALIAAAREKTEPYHAVILDMMLPPEKGQSARFDDTVCREVKARMSRALVAHITKYADDETVKKHLETVHGPSQIDLSFQLSKEVGETPEEGGFSSQLVQRLKPWLYTLRIEKQLEDLFNGGGFSGYSVAHFRPRESSGDRSRTHELAALTRNISTDWEHLPEGLKTRIRDIFEVAVKPNGEVTVSLF